MALATLTSPLDVRDVAARTYGLSKRFGAQVALGGVDLQLPAGAVYVLAGGNGAGKSTLLHILLNLVRPDEGRAEVRGLDTRGEGARVRAGIGYVPERTEAGHGWMTAGALMAQQATYYPAWDAQYAARLAQVLYVRLNRRLGQLSKGQARRVQLLTALAHRPPLLLLDEPTDGLDPLARDEVLGLLAEHLADTGCSILVSTHLVHEVDRIADHLGVLRDGRMLAQLPRDRLHTNLRTYRVLGPDGWVGPADLSNVLRREGRGRELVWTVWGDPAFVAARFTQSGGVVRDVATLSLEDAVLTLLRSKDLP